MMKYWLGTIILGIAFVLFAFFTSINHALLALFCFTIIFLFMLSKDNLLKKFLLAFLVSIIWMVIGWNNWQVSSRFLTIFNIKLAPIFAWTLGLFGGYLIYSFYLPSLEGRPFWLKLLLFWIFGFAVTGVLGLFTYMGVPICACIKAPLYLKVIFPFVSIGYFILLHPTNNIKNI
ncbi:hypothetical protein ACFL2V_20665 [Pseudomonadota bacterium]